MSKICGHIVWNGNPANKDRKILIHDQEIAELTPRLWALSKDYASQPQEVKERCFLQTLMKGSFSLLGIKNPQSALKVSACNIQIFLKILEQITLR